MTIFSGQSVISRVYTSRFGNGTGSHGTSTEVVLKKYQVPGTVPSGKPPKSEPYRTVPCRTMQWKSAISKLPKYLRDDFIEYLQLQGKLNSPSINPYNLQDFSGWLQVKAQQQRLSSRLVQCYQYEKSPSTFKGKGGAVFKGESTALYHGAASPETNASLNSRVYRKKPTHKVNCLFCGSKDHYITRCGSIKEKSVADLCKWISDGKRCWKCARSHAPETCNLKKPCSDCGSIHLQVLHGVAQSHATSISSATSESRVYLLPSISSGRVLLKVVPVLLHHKSKMVETYAILDDGAQRTMILPTAVQQLQLNGEHETLALRTVRPDTTHLSGFKVTFEISPRDNPKKWYKVLGAFTASGLDLVEQSYPVQALQRKYEHLRGIPLQPFHKVCPMVLTGSDQVHLITAKEPIRQGTKGGPMAVRTALGWALQGPEMSITTMHQSSSVYSSPLPTQMISTGMWKDYGSWMYCPFVTRSWLSGLSKIKRRCICSSPKLSDSQLTEYNVMLPLFCGNRVRLNLKAPYSLSSQI